MRTTFPPRLPHDVYDEVRLWQNGQKHRIQQSIAKLVFSDSQVHRTKAAETLLEHSGCHNNKKILESPDPQFTSSRRRMERAKLSMMRILSAANAGIFGTAIASSQERSTAVNDSDISLCICAATARSAEDSSRLRRCNAARTSRNRRSIPVIEKLI